jgi:sigma-E factor negative regulatory protein RseB
MKFIKLHITFFCALFVFQYTTGVLANNNTKNTTSTSNISNINSQKSINATREWLEAVQKQAKTSNFKGVVVMQKQNANNIRTRTFSITHFYDGNSEYEKINALDGNMRFIMRINQIVQAYVEQKKLIISTKRDDAGFPFITNNVHQVSKLYNLSPLGQERILGYKADIFSLTPRNPKDKRYSYKIWTSNDLILKIQTLWQDKLLEQVFFSDIQNIEFNQNEVQEWMSYGKNWQYRLPRMQEFDIKKSGWEFPREYKGYEYIKSMQTSMPKDMYMYQILYSDGLASISLFIETNSTHNVEMDNVLNRYKNINRGNNHIFAKNIGVYSITAVGEAPPVILEEIIDTIKAPE